MNYEIAPFNVVRGLRQRKGLTMRELAERMDIHFTTIAKIERSQRRLTPEWAERFAKALDVPIDQVMTADDRITSINHTSRRLPVIGLVAAGNWREAVQSAADTVPAPVDEPNAFALRVDGDSMDKITPDGSLVIVDPDQLQLHDGRLYVIMNHEAETTFKRYRSNPARLEPLSSNADHQPIILGASPFTVVGQVIGAYRPL